MNPSLLHTRSAIANGTELSREFELDRAAVNQEARTVELSFSSEAPVERWFGIEILDHGNAAVRMGRLRNGGALLVDHDRRDQVGVVESVTIARDKKGRAVVRFGRSARANEIFQDVVDGIRRLVSVGYRVHRTETTTSGGVETVRVVDWEPYEISLVSIPADDSVGVGRGEPSPAERNTNQNPNMNRDQIISQLRARGLSFDENASDDALRALLNGSGNSNGERQRAATITAIADQMQERSGVTVDASRAIAEGLTTEQFRERAFEALIAQRNTTYHPGMPAMSRSEQRDMSNYSITRAIRQASLGRLDGVEAEVSQELARHFGGSPNGFLVPHSALLERAMSVTGDSGIYGGAAVQTSVLGFLDALRPMLAVARAGATMMSGLSSNISIPRQVAASTATWKGEVAELDEKTPEIDDLVLTPKRVGAWTKVSKQLIAQSSPDVESFVRRDLLAAIAVAYDYAAIAGTGADNQPLGILATSGIGSVVGGTNGAAPTWANLTALVAAVANANALAGRPAFLLNTKVETKLRNTVKVASTDSRMILEEGQETLAGHKWYSTNNVPSDLTKGTAVGTASAIIFGNFEDVVLASFGTAVDLVVDPFTLATSGQTRVIATSFCDVGIRRAASFAAMKDALTA